MTFPVFLVIPALFVLWVGTILPRLLGGRQSVKAIFIKAQRGDIDPDTRQRL